MLRLFSAMTLLIALLSCKPSGSTSSVAAASGVNVSEADSESSDTSEISVVDESIEGSVTDANVSPVENKNWYRVTMFADGSKGKCEDWVIKITPTGGKTQDVFTLLKPIKLERKDKVTITKGSVTSDRKGSQGNEINATLTTNGHVDGIAFLVDPSAPFSVALSRGKCHGKKQELADLGTIDVPTKLGEQQKLFKADGKKNRPQLLVKIQKPRK